MLGLLQPILCIIFVMLIIAGVIASRVASKIVEPINELDLEKPEENEIYEEVAPLWKNKPSEPSDTETAGRGEKK